MNFTTAAIFLGILAGLAVALWGLFSKRRSATIATIAILVAILAAGGGWYAWAESESIPWTIGYAVVAVACLASAVRQIMGSGSARE
jgi:peptidoglycan/LPS O-acetylase OafA/YrhL